MTMKKMKNFMALLLALVMTMSLVACGNKASEETKTGEEIGCYVQTTETGEKVLVDKDGKAVTDFTLDADGNVLDADGNVVVKAEDITAYVEQSGNVTDEKAEEPKVDDAQKTEDKTDAKDEVKADDKKTETKVDESKKNEQKPADNKQDTSKTDTKTDTKTDNKSDNKSDTKTETPSQKPSTPSYDNGSLTTAQVKELQRWYGVTADGQWGAGSKKAAGGRTADEAWAYYQNNKQTTTPDQPSGGNTGNTGNNGGSTTPSKPSDDNSGSTGGGSTTPTEPTKPTKPTKADIDCAAAMSVGNSYAEGYGFTVDSACRSYFPPIYLERDCPESCWTQDRIYVLLLGLGLGFDEESVCNALLLVDLGFKDHDRLRRDGPERDRARHTVVRSHCDFDRVPVPGAPGALDTEIQLLRGLAANFHFDLGGAAVASPDLLLGRIAERDVPVGCTGVGTRGDGERNRHLGRIC